MHMENNQYYENGQLRFSEIETGLNTKLYNFFNEDGSIRYIRETKNDKIHGLSQHFNPNGTICSNIEHKNGFPNGITIFYFPSQNINGILIRRGESIVHGTIIELKYPLKK